MGIAEVRSLLVKGAVEIRSWLATLYGLGFGREAIKRAEHPPGGVP
jgi:hypothetical protein